MNKPHLLLPIMHVMFDDGLAVVFITPDFYIKMPEEDYKKYEHHIDETPKSFEAKALTLEEKIQAEANRLRGESTSPPPVAPSGAVALMTKEELAMTGGDAMHPLVAETMDLIEGLDLQQPDPLAEHGILLNDQAGPDGSDLNDEQWDGIIKLLMYPVTKAESKTAKGQSLVRAKQNAYMRIRGLPLAKLVQHTAATPRPIRMQLALYQCSRLGTGEKGEGGNWIPNSYAAYIEGVSDWAEREKQAIYDHAVDFREPREPRVKNQALAAAFTEEGFDFQTDLMSLEEQFSLSSTIN